MTAESKLRLIYRLDRYLFIDDKSKCWLWKGNVGTHGYGTLYFNGAPRLVHRLVCCIFFYNFDIDSPLKVKHKKECNNKNCFNPDHLTIESSCEPQILK